MGLLAVGQASLEKYRGLDVARAEMARLTAELSLQCSATALIGGELVILAPAGMPPSYEGTARDAERRLLIPPMCMCPVCWVGLSMLQPYLASCHSTFICTIYSSPLN